MNENKIKYTVADELRDMGYTVENAYDWARRAVEFLRHPNHDVFVIPTRWGLWKINENAEWVK